MGQLSPCRWRQELADGRYICMSARYFAPPNIVTAPICRKCVCADHEPAPPPLRSLPCVHLGRVMRDTVEHRENSDSAHLNPVFACDLHGTCRTDPPDEYRARIQRNCELCADYLPRAPFGRNALEMQARAESALAAVPEYPDNLYRGRGVVIAGGGERFFPALYVVIRALRHLGCRLPIQVWYLGRNDELPKARQALLKAYDVQCIDADKVRRSHPARRLDGWELKVFATLHCPFEELLFLDADCYPCRDPGFLFEQPDYQACGAIFWPDLMSIDDRLKWPAFGVANPRRLGSVESGQFVIHKRQSWKPLQLAWFYNDHSDYYYRYCHGDKHTFEVAWARCQQPFVMWRTQAPWVDVAILQSGPDGAPLFVHRCRDKFRLADHDYVTPQYNSLPSYYSALPMEEECWGWLTEVARLLHRKPPRRDAIEYAPTKKTTARRSAFAIATLYTPDIADLGDRTSRVLVRYARRHGYRTVVAKESLDSSRHPAWSKLLLVKHFLETHPRCRWLMWIDADAVISNPRQRLESLVDENTDFLVAEDRSAPSMVNTGVFFIRNCAATIEMIRNAYAKTHFLRHPCWEQPAVAEAIRECAATVRTRVVSRRSFNSFFDEYEKGEFVLHFAGCSHDLKRAGVQSAVERVERQWRRSASSPRAERRN